MVNQEFEAIGRKNQMLPNLGICCRELGGSKLRVSRMRGQFLLFLKWLIVYLRFSTCSNILVASCRHGSMSPVAVVVLP